ncbi:hypothetical protein JCM8547_001898 [Rhodosporidiobolus lusitaniae]
MATRRARPWHPPASRESYKDLLIVEERLKQNLQRLQKQRRKYEAFLIGLVGVIVYLAYIVFVVPSIYSLVHYGNVAMLLVAVTTLVLFFATGMYSEKIAYANQFVPQANRALRPFNIYLNTRHASWFSSLRLNPFRSSSSIAHPASPALTSSTSLSRTPSGRSIASDLSSPPLSRRTSSSSAHSSTSAAPSHASFRSQGALRSPSISPPSSPPLPSSSLPPLNPNDPVTRAPPPAPSAPLPLRGIPIPPIPPAQNPRGEVIFSSRVSPQFREGYERYRAEWEKRREEAKRLQRERERELRGAWWQPWKWMRRGSAVPHAGGAGAAAGNGEKGGAGGGEKRDPPRPNRSRESSAVPSEIDSAAGDAILERNGLSYPPPSRSPSPPFPLDPTARSLSHSRTPSSSPSAVGVLSSTSTPSSSAPSSRSASPARRSASVSPPASPSGRVRAESFSGLLAMETEAEEERGPMGSPGLERRDSSYGSGGGGVGMKRSESWRGGSALG